MNGKKESNEEVRKEILRAANIA